MYRGMNVNEIWAWLTCTVPSAGPVWVSMAVAVGAVIAITPRTWRATRLLATYVHEAAHASVAVLTGRRVTSIRLEKDTSGSTEHVGTRGLGRLLTAFAGYPGPALAAWGLIALTASGHTRWAAFAIAGTAVFFALSQRSWRGWVVTLALIPAAGVVAVLPAVAGSLAVAVLGGYLMAASPRTIVELHRHRRVARLTNTPRHSDADLLTSMTGIPPIVWEGLFLAACAAAVWRCALAVWA
jgi:hypothetical protein